MARPLRQQILELVAESRNKVGEITGLRLTIGKLNSEVDRLSNFNADVQLENFNLRNQRDILLSALGDSQMRTFILRRKTRGCKCEFGVAIQEFSEEELKDQRTLHER